MQIIMVVKRISSILLTPFQDYLLNNNLIITQPFNQTSNIGKAQLVLTLLHIQITILTYPNHRHKTQQ